MKLFVRVPRNKSRRRKPTMYYQRCEPPIEAAYLRPRRGDLARGFFRRGLGAPGNLTTTSPDTGLVTPAPRSSRSSRKVSRMPIIFGRASVSFCDVKSHDIERRHDDHPIPQYCPTPWTPRSAWRRSKRRWRALGGQRYSTPIRAASSPARLLPARLLLPRLKSPWTVADGRRGRSAS